MDNKKMAVLGVYKSSTEADNAAERLMSAGFSHNDISVLLPEEMKGPDDAVTGVAAGGLVGGTLGLLLGMGFLAIPGIGIFFAAGPLVGALAGLGVGGTAGGVIGAFMQMGVPEFEARRYEGHLRKGSALISVHCDTPEEVDRAMAVLIVTRAEDISATSLLAKV